MSTSQPTKVYLISSYCCSCDEPMTTKGYRKAFARGRCRCGAYEVKRLPLEPLKLPLFAHDICP